MEKLINKLEQNTYQNFNVIDNTEIKLENKNTFSKAQQGYRKNGNKLIPEWDEFVGEDFYIIGFSTSPIVSVVDVEATYRTMIEAMTVKMEAEICNLYGFKSSFSSFEI